MRSKVLRWRGERARLGTWRGRDGTAYLTPFPDSPALSSEFVERSIDLARQRGYRSIVTGALTPAESLGFVDAGFHLHEELCLLEHDLAEIPRAGVPTRRARRSDRPAILGVDARCFDAFWALDDEGLDEAIDATPWARFRVVELPDLGIPGDIAGYAVTGRAGTRGYLQRLGVAPEARRRGVGTALVADGLSWLAGRGVTRTLVNTHITNAPARALYERCQFRALPTPLRILTRSV